MDNQFVLSGKLIELDALRHTPAGIPVVNFRLSHASEQIEAGAARAVQCELAGMAFEREARLMAAAKPGMQVKVTGFLAGKSRESKQLVLHATNIEFVEGV
ncbi:MAG TPA: primosomal replication protein N [Burkholderiales bacterium]|nr:primosomal replication protein N [Burkholderiales bacterium]